MPPSQLKIATSSLQRLIKEEASYHAEQTSQEKRIAKLEARTDGDDEDGNHEFKLRQEKKALEETKAVFPSMRERIANAREKLSALLDSSTNEEEVAAAKKVLVQAIELQKGDPDSATVEG